MSNTLQVMKNLLTAALLAALFSGTAEAAQSVRIVMTVEATWADGDNAPILEHSPAEWVNDRTYISMISCRRALESDHAVYAAEMAKVYKFIQSSKYHGAKQLIARPPRSRCWIGPLPTQEQFLLPE